VLDLIRAPMMRPDTAITPAQCIAARPLIGMSRLHLAAHSGLSETTISYFERGQLGVRLSTTSAIRAALEAAGVVFIPENGGGAGVRLRKP
jgi:transcriptional regulator with XRE-family HTH domain